ncbi:unnamed protein product [Mytilus edulis]|uniref:Uncharacterized protein n=1 Tax=Mytilus edulis TaxID=6550 RepID=A0A8S3S8C7_MYTED|nr:unnamed protein product [Mytilus edulis]
MYLAKEAWLHTFQIDITRPREIHISKLPICSHKNHSSICSSMNSMEHLSSIYTTQWKHDLKETIQAIRILVPQTKLFESNRNGHAFSLLLAQWPKHNRCTSLVLEVTCGGDCVVIPILDLSLCPSYYGFSRPSVLDLTVASFPSCKMLAVWSSFEVTNKLTQKFVKIPTTLTLSFLQSYRIKKVLAQPFNAYIYVTHQGFATMLSQPANVSKQTVQALAADSDSLYPSLLA